MTADRKPPVQVCALMCRAGDPDCDCQLSAYFDDAAPGPDGFGFDDDGGDGAWSDIELDDAVEAWWSIPRRRVETVPISIDDWPLEG